MNPISVQFVEELEYSNIRLYYAFSLKDSNIVNRKCYMKCYCMKYFLTSKGFVVSVNLLKKYLKKNSVV